jgi:E3 ubiquitin-protein ligase SHPRH
VVLTTYDVLRNDLHHNPGPGEGSADAGASGTGASGVGGGEAAVRASRFKKKYEVIPTPLTRLTWWRVVLDEAQEVESSTAKAAAMARLVPAVHRWAVTGTPVSRGLEDLQGLFAFLGGPSPLTDARWWQRTVQAPFDAGDVGARAALHDVVGFMV